uniref:Putative ovule protein n=1 Tax=Solanum chacoense TaxID=4108 RepID=A0A0V0HPW0_SOLCH
MPQQKNKDTHNFKKLNYRENPQTEAEKPQHTAVYDIIYLQSEHKLRLNTTTPAPKVKELQSTHETN